MDIGILDPEGKELNPLTKNKYSTEYKKLAKFWKEYPAYEKRYDIIDTIQNNQVILIVSATGSGKTVLVPKFALHSLNYNGKIAITLPKQIIAKSSAEFSAKTLDVEIGEEVGYQYKGSPKQAKSDKTKLLYATDGTIRARLIKEPELNEFDIVIIDEAHERKVQIDFLLYLLRETLKKRPNFKLIIMSATIDTNIFKNYFNEFKYKQLDIGGKTNFPIESIFLQHNIQYYEILEKGYEIIKKIHKTTESGDILFFVTSSNEAIDICNKISKDNIKDIFCIEVYSGMNLERQSIAQEKDTYKKFGNYKRKLVIATNVAESSLTIDGIKYVIDSGYELSSSYDPNYRARILNRQLISNAQAKQRKGRSGRTESGICYHLYTEKEFNETMKKFPEPDIRTTDISMDCLELLNYNNIDTIDKLLDVLNEFIEPPKEEYIKTALNILLQLNYIENNKITELGKIANKLGFNPIHSKFLLYSICLNCSREVLILISLLETIKMNLSEIYTLPSKLLKNKVDITDFNIIQKKINEKYEKSRVKFNHKTGDHLSLLYIYLKFKEKYDKYHEKDYNKIEEWCYKNFLKINTLLKIRDNYKRTYYQLKQYILQINKSELSSLLDIKSNIIDLSLDERIIYCLKKSHNINIAYKTQKQKNNIYIYRTLYSQNIYIIIDKDSFINIKNKHPSEVLYGELFINLGKAELNIVSII